MGVFNCVTRGALFSVSSELIQFMSSGPVVAFELMGESAISKWRKMIGPTDSAAARSEAPASLRARFGTGKYTPYHCLYVHPPTICMYIPLPSVCTPPTVCTYTPYCLYVHPPTVCMYNPLFCTCVCVYVYIPSTEEVVYVYTCTCISSLLRRFYTCIRVRVYPLY